MKPIPLIGLATLLALATGCGLEWPLLLSDPADQSAREDPATLDSDTTGELSEPDFDAAAQAAVEAALPDALAAVLPDALAQALEEALAALLAPVLTEALPAALDEAIPEALQAAVNEAIPQAFDEALPDALSAALADALAATLPDALDTVLAEQQAEFDRLTVNDHLRLACYGLADVQIEALLLVWEQRRLAGTDHVAALTEIATTCDPNIACTLCGTAIVNQVYSIEQRAE